MTGKAIDDRNSLIVARGPKERCAAEAALALCQLVVEQSVRLPLVDQVCGRPHKVLLQRSHLFQQTTLPALTRMELRAEPQVIVGGTHRLVR